MRSFIVIALMLVYFISPAQNSPANDDVNIPFGLHNKIVYHVQNGTYDVIFENKKIISSAYAALVNGADTITLTGEDHRIFRKRDISDRFGKGFCYEFTVASGRKSPIFTQQFYVYAKREYFFTQLIMEGSSVSSNYMAPLITGNASIYATGDNRTLFVPFDNDTFISYNAISMNGAPVSDTSAEAGAVYDDISRRGLVTGSI